MSTSVQLCGRHDDDTRGGYNRDVWIWDAASTFLTWCYLLSLHSVQLAATLATTWSNICHSHGAHASISFHTSNVKHYSRKLRQDIPDTQHPHMHTLPHSGLFCRYLMHNSNPGKTDGWHLNISLLGTVLERTAKRGKLRDAHRWALCINFGLLRMCVEIPLFIVQHEGSTDS